MSGRTLTVKEDILGANRQKAETIRKLLRDRHILMLNILSAPGSGKTSLILQTIHQFSNKWRIAVIEGDIASSIDADKIAKQNIPAVQINTRGGCHLDAQMIQRALEGLDLEPIDLIFLENIGNLVCAADFDLGAHKNIVILSIPEGDDKPHKFPMIFVEADAILVNKIDVFPYFDFNLESFPEMIRSLNPSAPVFPISAKTGEGLECWFSWIERNFNEMNSAYGETSWRATVSTRSCRIN